MKITHWDVLKHHEGKEQTPVPEKSIAILFDERKRITVALNEDGEIVIHKSGFYDDSIIITSKGSNTIQIK